MTTGFEVRRSDGKEAVSSVYQHYAFVKKVRLTAQVHWWDTSGQTYSKHVIVAFRQTGTAPTAARFSIGGRILWYGFGGSQPPANATLSLFSYDTADAYIFDVAPSTSPNKYGLQVFNAQGQCTFDASRRFMRIVDVIQDTAPTASNPWTNPTTAIKNYTYPTAHKLAFIPIKEAYEVEFTRDSEQMYGKTWQAALNGSIKVQMVYFYEDGGTNRDGYRAHLPFTLVVVDVAHIDAA